MDRFVIVLPVVVSLLAGCKDQAQCDKERNDLNKAWTALHSEATRRKNEGVDVPGWSDVEKKAETLESSFMTTAITWESAAKARDTIAAALPNLHADRDSLATSFRSAAESAFKQQESFEKECR